MWVTTFGFLGSRVKILSSNTLLRLEGPRAKSSDVLIELDELKVTQDGGNLPRQEVSNIWCFFYYLPNTF